MTHHDYFSFISKVIMWLNQKDAAMIVMMIETKVRKQLVEVSRWWRHCSQSAGLTVPWLTPSVS